MEKQMLNRLRYLKQNYDYLSSRELYELNKLEAQYRMEQDAQVDAPEYEDSYYEEENNFQDDSEGKELGAPNYSRQLSRNGRSHGRKVKDPKNKKKASKIKGDKPKKKRHWIRNILLLILLVIVVMAGFFAYGYQRGISHEGGGVKAEQFNGEKTESGAVNILILGADQRPNQSSNVAHTDSIMVLQLKPKDGKIKLVSFMRDTLVHVPGYSEAGQQDIKINAAYTLGEQAGHKGADLLRKTIQENFGVKCQYYALLDFSSFATVIDSLFPNGVEIDAKFATINGQHLPEVPVPDDLAATEGKVSSDRDLTEEEAAALGYPDGGGTFMMIKPGKQRMNGRTLLNYARFRHDDENDFGRVKRQQQVMSTVMSKMKNPLTLFTGASALGTARAVTETNIPNSFFFLHSFGTILNARNGIQTYTVPDASKNDYSNAYDMYYGLGLKIDLATYRQRLTDLLGN